MNYGVSGNSGFRISRLFADFKGNCRDRKQESYYKTCLNKVRVNFFGLTDFIKTWL